MPKERNNSTVGQKNSRPRSQNQRELLWWVGSGLALIVAVLVAWVVAIRMGNRLGYVPLITVLLAILIRLGYRYEWTGFKKAAWPEDEKKTLWDWMQLLFVPLMIAVLAGGLTWWQTSSEHARQAEEAARQEAFRAQNTAIQVYLDQMTNLMLEEHLTKKEPDSEVRTIAQARTTAILQAVELENKRTLLQFLSDTGLVQQQGASSPILSLDHADLSESDLRDIELGGANLSFADLSGANLSHTDLSDAELVNADLQDANLSGAHLSNAYLSHADLREADLREADLSDASMGFADLRKADLSGAYMSNAYMNFADLREADLSNAYLREAELHATNLSDTQLNEANLSDTQLDDTDLSEADLSGTNLSGAYMNEANLSGAAGWTRKELATATSLEGATMPNGQKYEDWLKVKEGHR